MSEQRKHLFCFGGFELDLQKRLLWRNGELIPLPPKQGETLVCLVERDGGIVEKKELVSRVWPGINVGENNLSQVITGLRKTLGTATDGRQYIENIPTRGYRFVGPPLPAEVGVASKRQDSDPFIEASIQSVHTVPALEVPYPTLAKSDSASPANRIFSGTSPALGKRGLLRLFALSGFLLIALAVGYVLGGSRWAANPVGRKWIKLQPVKISEYEFEDAEQGWIPGPNMMITHVFSSTEHAYRGKRSLALVFDGPYARRSQVL